MTGRAMVGTGAVAGLAIVAVLVVRRAPAPPSSPGGTAVAEIVAVGRAAPVPDHPSGSRAPSATRMRALIAENFALQRETERLQQALAAPAVPIVYGLPVAPAPVATADELRSMDEIHQRLTALARPTQARLYREVKGEAPAGEMTFEELASALLEAGGVTDYETLTAEMNAATALRKQNSAPPPGAPPARRVLWQLLETGDLMERELEGTLPPDRLATLQRSGDRGFGFSISMTNGHWLVELSRPGS